ncbi:hypothetical protein WL94_09705 [Burkholderia cepacia]|nr:hypothetical protein WL94_09705 [Burkholderia cepacia]
MTTKRYCSETVIGQTDIRLTPEKQSTLTQPAIVDIETAFKREDRLETVPKILRTLDSPSTSLQHTA